MNIFMTLHEQEEGRDFAFFSLSLSLLDVAKMMGPCYKTALHTLHLTHTHHNESTT